MVQAESAQTQKQKTQTGMKQAGRQTDGWMEALLNARTVGPGIVGNYQQPHTVDAGCVAQW